MEKGGILKINYTGREKSSGEVFDTTLEKEAVKAGIFDKNRKYAPIVVVAGEGDLLPALDSILTKMKKGEKRTVSLKPGEAFGERNPKLAKMVPLQEFRKRDIKPFPGLIVELNNLHGRVQSVSGGRVRVDFNHPLAGKEVEFDLSVEDEITDRKEKVEALFGKFFQLPEGKGKLEVKESEVRVSIPSEFALAAAQFKKPFSEQVLKHIKGIKKVKFEEEFLPEKEKEKDMKKSGEKEKTLGKERESAKKKE